MTDTSRCTDELAGALAQRYLAGRLGAPDVERFEVHYLTCARCQEELRIGASIRRGLRAMGESLAEKPRARGPRSSWRTASALSGVAAAGIALVVALSGIRETSVLEALGGVSEAPPYVGTPIRSRDLAASRFERGMRAYGEQRFRDAIAELEASARDEGDAAPTRFFLGASLLMAGEHARAATELRAAIAMGDTPYRAEAHYYAAKALLRSGNAPEAIAELRRASGLGDPVSIRAASLADSVARVIE